MLDPWNDASLLPPPVWTSTCPKHSNIDIKQVAHTCNNIVNVLTKQSPLHNEAAVLSRFIYKFDRKFRNDIGYRNFKKVNTALKKYLALNLLKDIESFSAVLPGTDDEYLPTRQMLEYVLVRIMAFSKIMVRICTCSKQAAVFYLDRLKRGESHWMSLMPYALCSRIWSMTMVLLRHSCVWYANLISFLNQLTSKGLKFLPPNYELPTDLEKWLEMSELDNFGRFEWSKKVRKTLEIDTGFIEDKEGDVFENILEYVNHINDDPEEQSELESVNENQKKPDIKTIDIPSITNIQVDEGEKISREAFTNILKGLQPKKKIIHYAERVSNKQTLNLFIEMEETLRNEGSDLALTSHLSFMQWQTLKKYLTHLYDSPTTDRKVQRKFQKVWKEKCLDYK